MSFYAEEIEIPAWRSYGDVSAFCMDAPARFAELRAVENVTKTLNEIRNDRSRFPIKKRGAYSEVTKWVRDCPELSWGLKGRRFSSSVL